MGLHAVISAIHRDNAASRRVAEKIGLQLWREADLVPIVVYATGPPVA